MIAAKHRMCLPLAALSAVALVACGSDGGGTSVEDEAQAGTTYPDGDITFVIPYGPGGSFDPMGRFYASMMEKELDTTIVVENREGGAATIGTQYVLDAEPDGYTIGMGSGSAIGFQPHVNDDLNYSGPEDVLPIVNLGESRAAVVVRADSPFRDLGDLIEFARENPGELDIGVSGRMSSTDIALHQLMSNADIELVSVPFTGGGGENLIALLGGQIDATFTAVASALGQVEAGELRLIAVGGTDRVEAFPDVPAIGEFVEDPIAQQYLVIGPQGIPEDRLEVLVEASLDVVNSDEFAQFCEENFFQCEPLVGEELAQELATDFETYGELIGLFEQ